MYLHIGNVINIKKRAIIGIFDLDTATLSLSLHVKEINQEPKINHHS